MRFLSVFFLIVLPYGLFAQLSIAKLTCDYRVDPINVALNTPGLSWQIISQQPDVQQAAYHIQVASSYEKLITNEADLWDSEWKSDSQSAHVPYAGKPLASRDQCFWRVRVRDQKGRESPWSAISYWEMALLKKTEWEARWIRHPDYLDTLYASKPAPWFRKEFEIDKKIRKARLYVTGLGYYACYLNGRKVGDQVLDPVKSRYDRSAYYQIFDVTEYLHQDRNAIGMVLGTGWYNHFAHAVWEFDQAPWRDYPTLICQLEITYADGSSARIVSDRSWKTTDQGPVRFDGIRNGETYDARLELTGWNTASYDDSIWQNAVEVIGPKGTLRPQEMPPMKEMKRIKPVAVTEIKPGVYVFDLGQNIAGYSEINVAGPRGTEIRMKHGERLYPDGSVEQKQILRFLKSGDAQTDRYILRGEGIEKWKPRFVYHGYQYVEVHGLPVPPTLETLTGIVVHTAFDRTGDFSCANPLFNRIHQLTHWSFIGNYHGLPTDCPHREKIGWTGDAHLVTETGMLNYDMLLSYRKWMDDFVDEQREDGSLPGVIPTSGWGYEHGRDPATRHLGYGPSWEGAFILIPWYLYTYTGDISLLQRYYRPMKKYMEHLDRSAEKHLLTYGIDDHKAYFTKTGGPIISSGYYVYFNALMSRIAQVLSHEDDRKVFAEQARKSKKAFIKAYVNKNTASVGNGGQTSLAEALYFDLLGPDKEEATLEILTDSIRSRNYHFDAGVVGVKFLLEALAKHKRDSLIYRMVDQTDFPSYGWWIEQGANTLWQDWDGSMSLNHIMFGSVDTWFYERIAGIAPDPDAPGFRVIRVEPQTNLMKWASGTVQTPYGTVRHTWNIEKNKFQQQIVIPPNSSARIVLPCHPEEVLIQEELAGKALTNFRSEAGGEYEIKLPSGNYHITCPVTQP